MANENEKSDGSLSVDSQRATGGFGWMNRLPAAVLFTASTALLIVAASLQPDPDGFGTHTQLGMDRCGFVAQTGLPCATCGITTAFAHAADGDVLSSFVTQPAGAVMAVLTAMVSIVTGYAMIVGVSLVPIGRQCWRPKPIIAMIVLVLAAWGYKMLVFEGA